MMPSGLLTKVSINVLFICVGRLEFGFSHLPGELEYIKPEGIIWPLYIGISFDHDFSTV